MPHVEWTEDVYVSRVTDVYHDITRQPPVGVLCFIAREGGFRAVRFDEIERISGNIGATEARQSFREQVEEVKAERRLSRRERRIQRRKRGK